MGKTFSTGLLTNGVFQDSSNNIGIGAAANASFKLQVTGATNLTGALSGTSATFTSGVSVTNGYGFTSSLGSENITFSNSWFGGIDAIYQNSGNNNDFGIYTNGGTSTQAKLYITNGGNVGIGTSSPSVKLDVGGASNTDSTARFAKTSEGSLLLGGNRSTSNCPFIGSENNYDFALITNNTERMRITSGGNVGINTTSGSSILNVVGNAGAYTCSLQGSTTSGQSYGLIINGGSTSGDYSLFVRNAAQGSPYIYVRGDGYLYSASAWSGSDRRLKENITDLDNGLNKVLGLKARKFDFIDGFKNQYGFIAQELQEIIPDAVSVFDEKEEMLAVKMDFIIPHLVKAIQELTQKVNELESKIK
jgi:hypothetical protein